jgi:predicted nucleic acid-binding protein
VDAFDADVLIYAATPAHPLGLPVLRFLDASEHAIGSVLLVPELLTKPLRDGAAAEHRRLVAILGHLDLVGLDRETAGLASVLGAKHGLRAADAVHLATALSAGADRFVTNNQKDFPRTIAEIDVVYPVDLTR